MDSHDQALSAPVSVSAGPTAYARLMDKGILAPHDFLLGGVNVRTERFAKEIGDELLIALREAYVAGVRDGYATAVAEIEAPA